MDSIQENCYPATLPELSLFPSLGGQLKGGPKGCWGRPDPPGSGLPRADPSGASWNCARQDCQGLESLLSASELTRRKPPSGTCSPQGSGWAESAFVGRKKGSFLWRDAARPGHKSWWVEASCIGVVCVAQTSQPCMTTLDLSLHLSSRAPTICRALLGGGPRRARLSPRRWLDIRSTWENRPASCRPTQEAGAGPGCRPDNRTSRETGWGSLEPTSVHPPFWPHSLSLLIPRT